MAFRMLACYTRLIIILGKKQTIYLKYIKKLICKEERLLMVNKNAQCKCNSLWTNNTKED